MYITPRHPETQQQIPLPPPPPRSAAPAPSSPFKIDVLRSLKVHAMTASLVAIATCGLGLALLLRHHAVYTASSTVYVSPNFPKTLTEDREQEFQYDSYIQQEMHSVTRYDVISEALKKLPSDAWKRPNESMQAAIGRLQGAVDVSRISTTYEASISLTDTKPANIAEIVNAITNTYLEKVKDEEFYGRDERLQTLRQERDRVRTDLDARLKEQAGIAGKLGMAIVGSTGTNPYDSDLDKMRGDLNTAHTARIQAEAQLSSLNSGDPNAPNSALNAAADEIAALDPGLTSLKSALGQKRSALLGTLAGLTPNNPLRKQTEDELAQTDNAIATMQANLRRRAAQRLEEKLHSEVNRAAAVEAQLNHDIQKKTTQATTAAPEFQRSDELKNDIQNLQTRYNTIDERISNLELESSSPGSVHMVQPARTPIEPEPSKMRKLFPAIFPLALIMGVLAAVAFDLLDPHLYTSSDVETVMGFAPIGVLLDDREVTQLVYDECSLRLAAGIDHAAHSAGVRTFVITGVTAGAGTTTIIEHLGSTLAKLGRKTLTIDASGATHPVAYTTVNANESGRRTDAPAQSSVLPVTGTELQTTTVVSQPLQSKIPPLTTSFMAKAFQELTNEYDIVLIDAAPLLISAETEYLARFADVTVLVGESGKTKKSDLKRSAKLLERLNVGGVAVIINKVGLLRAEKDLKQDLIEFEARMNRTNLRWQPRARPETEPFVPFVTVKEEIVDAETVSSSKVS
ncbi:GumC family protein [Silvibacterium acidisoli]|uniref:GumC family protein n=1 Tax=Acidobacteriaceae bacterium ZG23-2 TaxID=2883246 RepID=UPI00406C1CED